MALFRCLVLTAFSSNCYLWLEEGETVGRERIALVIDPGGDEDRIFEALARENARPVAVLATHAHLDHVGAVGALQQRHPGLPFLLHADDLPLLEQLPLQCQMFGLPRLPVPRVTATLSDREWVRFPPLALEVIHVPGHSPGGLCFLAGDLLFSGDTLFAGNVGRTDLPGGDLDRLLAGIRRDLFTLPGGTRVLPGHDGESTIAEERKNNPFVGTGCEGGGSCCST